MVLILADLRVQEPMDDLGADLGKYQEEAKEDREEKEASAGVLSVESANWAPIPLWQQSCLSHEMKELRYLPITSHLISRAAPGGW